jgi:hypothetical protein
VNNLHLADEHARKIGLPLNTFVTVSWLLTAHSEIDAKTFGQCRQRMCQWLRRNDIQPCWQFVHENPCSAVEGDTKPNTHILVHVPKRIITAFKAKASDWFDATMDGAVLVEPRTRANYQGLDRLHYMAKGTDGFTARRFGGYRKPGGQGVVLCKRSGVSQNVSWKARQKAGAS